MELPQQLQTLLVQFSKSVEADSQHRLYGYQRLELYEAFESPRSATLEGFLLQLDFPEEHNPTLINYEQLLKDSFLRATVADHALYWLAILTFDRVLPLYNKWDTNLYQENENLDEDLPKRILELAKKIISYEISFEEGYQDYQTQFPKPYPSLSSCLTYPEYCVYEAAYYALDFILTHRMLIWMSEEPDETVGDNMEDFALSAMKAFVANDSNLPGKWSEAGQRMPIEFDKFKRSEFWKWWLLQAIPQAWELANSSLVQ